MPSQQTDHLFTLIKTMSKSEKRHFKLYVNRNQGGQDTKFQMLFDVLDKSSSYDEEHILKKITSIKRQQLSNLKAHLYKQLLVSLRLLHKNKLVDVEIREHLDYARILYKKGLYLQSLKILAKIKEVARKQHLDILHLEIVEFEKLIESRHITRSIEGRADLLSEESDRLMHNIKGSSSLSSLSLRMYGRYLDLGHIRNEEEGQALEIFFKSKLPKVDQASLSFFERFHWETAHTWYNYIKQDWVAYYRNASKWVALFDQNPEIREKHPVMYMKGLHNVLNALFLINNNERFKEQLDKLQSFYYTNEEKYSTNTHIRAFLYIYMARINQHFMEGTFSKGLELVPEIAEGLEKFRINLDLHRSLVFFYKIACLYFGAGQYASAIEYLNRVIQLRIGNLRADIQCYSRMLHLIAHFELGHYDLLEHLIKSVYRFLLKHQDLSLVHQAVLKFLRKALGLLPDQVKPAFEALKQQLIEISNNPFEARAFLYLDLISWLEASIERKTVEEMIRIKFESNK
ncbi:MAG: hypothetical protein AAF502_18075 [Bacteroidota bacterium]